MHLRYILLITFAFASFTPFNGVKAQPVQNTLNHTNPSVNTPKPSSDLKSIKSSTDVDRNNLLILSILIPICAVLCYISTKVPRVLNFIPQTFISTLTCGSVVYLWKNIFDWDFGKLHTSIDKREDKHPEITLLCKYIAIAFAAHSIFQLLLRVEIDCDLLILTKRFPNYMIYKNAGFLWTLFNPRYYELSRPFIISATLLVLIIQICQEWKYIKATKQSKIIACILGLCTFALISGEVPMYCKYLYNTLIKLINDPKSYTYVIANTINAYQKTSAVVGAMGVMAITASIIKYKSIWSGISGVARYMITLPTDTVMYNMTWFLTLSLCLMYDIHWLIFWPWLGIIRICAFLTIMYHNNQINNLCYKLCPLLKFDQEISDKQEKQSNKNVQVDNKKEKNI